MYFNGLCTCLGYFQETLEEKDSRGSRGVTRNRDDVTHYATDRVDVHTRITRTFVNDKSTNVCLLETSSVTHHKIPFYVVKFYFISSK